MRMGLYRTMYNWFKEKRCGETPLLYEKAISGAIGGSIGGFCSNPTDLIMVRF